MVLGRWKYRPSSRLVIGEILIYLVLYNVNLLIYFICETEDFEKEIKSLLLNCSHRLTVDLNSYTGLGVEMFCLTSCHC